MKQLITELFNFRIRRDLEKAMLKKVKSSQGHTRPGYSSMVEHLHQALGSIPIVGGKKKFKLVKVRI